MHPTASALVSGSFLLVSLALLVAVAVGLRRFVAPGWRGWLLFGLWLAVPLALALAGVLPHWERFPPPLMPLVALWVTGSVLFVRSEAGRKVARDVPLAVLVGLQAFRLPLELVMHEAAVEGTMPPQLSFTGWNFDIVTGVLAIPLALWLARGAVPRAVVVAWNVLGLALLVNVVTLSIASLPVLAAFGPERLNTWIAYAPFTWLPTLEVQVAFAGHLLVFRRLAVEAAALRGSAGPDAAGTVGAWAG